MELWHAVLLGIVEGMTEFLPVSSTGHIILTSHIVGLTHTVFLSSFEIIIQLGAILAVLLFYSKRLLLNTKTVLFLVISFVPTALVGFILYRPIKDILLGNIPLTSTSLIVGGILFWLLELYMKNRKNTHLIKDMNPIQALLIGIGQSISIIPGVSRSAASMFTGMLTGLTRKEAVEYSFLLAIPTILAASGYDLFKMSYQFSSQELMLLSVGLITAFISSLITLQWFLRFISTHSFIPFAIYRILVGLIFLLLWFL